MVDWHIDYYTGLNGVYFRRILKKIIRVGNLKNNNKKILDFGCGVGYLKKIIGDRVINYDILKDLSSIADWKEAEFDIIVSNEVFHYMEKPELINFLYELYTKNKDVKMVLGVAKTNLLTKIAMTLSRKTDAHDGIVLNHKEIMDILKKKMIVIKKTSVFQMCDIYIMKFRE